MKFTLSLYLLFTILSCHPDDNPGKALVIQNNSDQNIYYWYSGNYNINHYPDTLLPVEKPVYFNFVGKKSGAGASGYDPDWQSIYSQLPADLFTVYFFDHAPQTQEEWEEIRGNYDILARKDVTFEELKANDYTIYYP